MSYVDSADDCIQRQDMLNDLLACARSVVFVSKDVRGLGHVRNPGLLSRGVPSLNAEITEAVRAYASTVSFHHRDSHPGRIPPKGVFSGMGETMAAITLARMISDLCPDDISEGGNPESFPPNYLRPCLRAFRMSDHAFKSSIASRLPKPVGQGRQDRRQT